MAALALSVFASGLALAHAVEHVGPYTVEVGWQNEPTYVGQPNGVQIIIHDASNKPVTDLGANDMTATVSTGGQQSGQLTFSPGFDPVEMGGNLGEYDAAIVPTVPGDYTFHLTGTIHGQPVDLTVTSGDTTFDTVKSPADIDFPTKLPTIDEIVTRLDRIDSRLTTTGSGPTQASVDAATAAAASAHDDADRALLFGVTLGMAGIVVALLGVVIALRANRRSAG